MTNLKRQIETANSPCIFKFNSKLREIERERERERERDDIYWKRCVKPKYKKQIMIEIQSIMNHKSLKQ